MNLVTGPTSMNPPDGDFSDIPHPLPPELPPLPIPPKGPIIVCFCNAAHGNANQPQVVASTWEAEQLFTDPKHKHKPP